MPQSRRMPVAGRSLSARPLRPRGSISASCVAGDRTTSAALPCCVGLWELAASEIAADQLAVSELLDEPDVVRNTAAADDVQHVGGGQDFVVAAAEPDCASQRVRVCVLVDEADAVGR